MSGPLTGEASTGPRSIERGRWEGGRDAHLVLTASTGPRSIERGRLDPWLAQETSVNQLQRGRAQLSAEGNGQAVRARVVPALQRGRAQLSAEGRPDPLGRSSRRVASTGPRSIERGRTAKSQQVHVDPAVLQRGRAQLSAEGRLSGRIVVLP